MSGLGRLFYDAPAVRWTEALPLGNGRLGAMVFGGARHERIQLNEESLWSGHVREWDNPNALKYLPLVREAAFRGDFEEADRLARKMQGPYTESYLPLGNLYLDFRHPNIVEDYQRSLDINQAVSKVEYRIGSVLYTRQMFMSAPDQILIVRITCSQPEKLQFSIRLDSPLRYSVQTQVPNRLELVGQAPSHVAPDYCYDPEPIQYVAEGGMPFAACLYVCSQGGTIQANGGQLEVFNANEVLILLSAATGYPGFNASRNNGAWLEPLSLAQAILDTAVGKTFSDLLQDHLVEYQSMFDRVKLDLGSLGREQIPTDRRIISFQKDYDPEMVSLLFQYGRYLLISSSRPGTYPPNLQGIWNDLARPPWSSNYTININTQMNYWPAEITNLPECHTPLFDFTQQLSINGEKTAQTNYGAKGWCSHHNTDLWRQSGPVGDFGEGKPQWVSFPLSGVWLCHHLWDHYAFGGNLNWLRSFAYPIMRSAAEFCLDWLVEGPDGHLVTCPSISAENAFITAKGIEAETSLASTFDLSIIREHFHNCLAASRALGEDADFARLLETTLDRMYPFKIGGKGDIQEWYQDWDSPDPHHRHISHLFGLYPGRLITQHETPELFSAARRSLELRGDESTGWSMAWKVCCWARLRDGDHALKILSSLFTPSEPESTNYVKGGSYPNLLDAHPPFQIDGNFGATAGIAEMLLQSHAGYIEALPALPATWINGSVRGLRAKGGFEIDMTWSENRLKTMTICSHAGNECRIASPDCLILKDSQPIHTRHEKGLLIFATEPGGVYLMISGTTDLSSEHTGNLI